MTKAPAPQEIAVRYVVLWNEPDNLVRRAGIDRLFAVNCAHFTPSMAVRGLDEMEDRIATAHATGGRSSGCVL